MRTRCLVLVAVALLSDAAPARADEFKPGYLQLTQLDHQTYDVLWKIPAIDESTTLKVKPQFPDGTEALTEVRSTFSRGVTVLRWYSLIRETDQTFCELAWWRSVARPPTEFNA